jgi:hypothetical protein
VAGQERRIISEGFYEVVSGNQAAPLLGVVPSIGRLPISPFFDMDRLPASQASIPHAIQPSNNSNSTSASHRSTGRAVIFCKENDESNIRRFICLFNFVTGQKMPENLSLDEFKEQCPDDVIDFRELDDVELYEDVKCRSETMENENQMQTSGLYLPSSLALMSSDTGKKLLLAHKHGALSCNKVVEKARDYVYMSMETGKPAKLDIEKKQESKTTRSLGRDNTEKRYRQERQSTSTEDSISRNQSALRTRLRGFVDNGKNSDDPGSLTEESLIISDNISLSSSLSQTSSDKDRPPQPPPKSTRPPWPEKEKPSQLIKSGGSPMEASEQQHAEMKRQESDASVTSSSSSNSSCDSGCALPFIEDQDMGEPLEVEQPARSSEKPPLAAKPYTAKQTVGANSTSFKSPKLTSISAK